MEANATDPSRAGLEFFLQFLRLQIIDSYPLPRSDEEQWLRWVETSRLRETFEAFERVLGLMFR